MKLFSFFNRRKNKFVFKCSCCGKVYEEMPLCFGGEFPDSYFDVAPEERERRIEITESLCVIDKELFFHRGRIIIPIFDHNEHLVFNVWTSISEENFRKRNDLWSDPDRIKQDPYFGWLQTIVPTYGETLNIKTLAYEQEVGFIPTIKVIEENHALTIDQENGITFKIATEKVESILKEYHKNEVSKN
jgi:hypothetical protein